MKACPICHKQEAAEFRPFCSARCREVDLGKWFAGSYAIPSETPPTEEELDQIVAAIEASTQGDVH